jgi:hypothetical protein
MSDPAAFKSLTETDEFFTISAQNAVSERIATIESSPPLEDPPEWYSRLELAPSRSCSASPLPTNVSTKEHSKRINHLNLKLFSMEQDHEVERQHWLEENNRLRQEAFMLQQPVSNFQERLSALVHEKEVLTLAAELYSENSFNQVMRGSNVASSLSVRFLRRCNSEVRQHPVSTSVSDSKNTAVNNFEQLKRSFTDSIKQPSVCHQFDSGTLFTNPFAKEAPRQTCISEEDKEAADHFARPDHVCENDPCAENRLHANSLFQERPSDEEIQPWHSLASTRPTQLEAEEASRQLAAAKPSHSAKRSPFRSLCAPSALLDNP